MNDNNIIAKSITYAYGDNLAVDHISFEVAKGEIIGFLGPNGAGKTTTVRVLTGQLIAQEGQALILGEDIAKDPDKIQAKMGVSFEEKNLYPRMTARQNLIFFAELFGIKKFDPDPLLAKVGLAGREKEKVENYSKGMKQRLMIARSILNQPEVLFLDEPTDGLDPASSEVIRQVILDERKRGATVFLTTHDMLEADKLSDKVAFINEGKIVALDTPENLKLKHGQRGIKAKIFNGDQTEEKYFEMDKEETPEQVKNLLSQNKVATIHTSEASLEEIFIKLTGAKLD
ncbi:MAG: ABC transporter ATP-binding protein [Patescibacteria group bacterium]